MRKPNDMSRCLAAFDQDSTLVAVIELGLKSWLVAGIVPGIERHPLKKLKPNEGALLALLYRWCEEARKAGHPIKRICVAFEAGRDGFWLARWLRNHKIEAYVIHPTSVPVSREHRRAKTDRLDTGRLMRAFIGWLRGETDHCSMCAIPTLEEEDDKRPNREHEYLVGLRTAIINRLKSCMARLGIRGFNPTLKKAPEHLAKVRTPEGTPIPPNTLDELKRDMTHIRLVIDQIKDIEKTRLARLREEPKKKSHAMVLLLARVRGLGIETADVLTHEAFLRNLRDRRAVPRYAGLTAAPDESGEKHQEKGLARVRRSMIELAWRFLEYQKESALVHWYWTKTADRRKDIRKIMIVALARKLLIALWRMVTTGEIPEGVELHPHDYRIRA